MGMQKSGKKNDLSMLFLSPDSTDKQILILEKINCRNVFTAIIGYDTEKNGRVISMEQKNHNSAFFIIAMGLRTVALLCVTGPIMQTFLASNSNHPLSAKSSLF